MLDKPYVEGLSILGGEPLHPKNVNAINELILKVRERFSDVKNIWLWSGFTYEKLNPIQLDCVRNVDVMVDGQFVDGLKDFRLKYRGSSNQRVIDIRKTLEFGNIVQWSN